MSTLRASFRDLAAWADGNSPLYARHCRVAADDEDLLALAEAVPADRSAPHLLLAAVHYLLLRGEDHPLEAYYPTVTESSRAPDDALATKFRTFCLANAEALRDLLATRRTQTNAVRRSAVLYPAVARVAAVAGEPLALVELGASAGLNLNLDRYAYDYGTHGSVGRADASVTLTTEVRAGEPPLPSEPPWVGSRIGIDLNPLDLTDPDDVDWLRALVWPEHRERRRLLEDALAVAREHVPRVTEGTIVSTLPDVLDEIPDDRPVCVYNTLVLYQLSPTERERVRDTVHSLAADRPIHWLSGDGDLDDDHEVIRLEWTRKTDGEVRTDLLAGFQPHCEWIEWFGT